MELNARTLERATHTRVEREILEDRDRTLSVMDIYLAGRGAPFDPTKIGTHLALVAIHADPSAGPVLDDLTARLADAWPHLRAGDWAPEVLWHWPGLAGYAHHQPASHPLRTDIRTAVPDLATPDGWQWARALVVDSNTPTVRWPWPTLTHLAAHLASRPDHDPPS